jgi:hypothetical protein
MDTHACSESGFSWGIRPSTTQVLREVLNSRSSLKCQAAMSFIPSCTGILNNIQSASSCQKVSLTNASSHEPVVGSIISSFTRDSKLAPLGVNGRRSWSLCSHSCSQIWILAPSPTRHMKPFFSRFSPVRILRQVYDMSPFGLAYAAHPHEENIWLQAPVHKEIQGAVTASMPALLTLPHWM